MRRIPGLAPARAADVFERAPLPVRLRRDIERLLDEVFSGAVGGALTPGEFLPLLEMAESDKGYLVTAELPGMSDKDIDVEVDDDGVLTIRGEKKSEKAESRGGYEFSERSYGEFVRTLQLPANVDANKIEARMHDGILELHIPKTAEVHAHAIPIGKQEPKQMAESGSSKSDESAEKTEKAAGSKAS